MQFLLVTIAFLAYASALQQTILGVFRPELVTKVEVVQLLATDNPPEIDPTQIRVKASPDSDIEVDFRCVDNEKNLNFTENNAWIGCCPPLTQLKGSETSGFDCCAEGQELTRCKDERKAGCCYPGSIYNGTECVVNDYENPNPCAPQPGPCPDGSVKINNHCHRICPPGQELVNKECLDECGFCQSRMDDGNCLAPRCNPGFHVGPDEKWGGCTCLPDKPVDEPPCPAGEIPIKGNCVLPCSSGTVMELDSCDRPVCVVPCLGKVVDPNLGCICPPGTTESTTGNCQKDPCDWVSNQLQVGKCYTITFENGRQLEYDSESNFYIASGSTGGHESGPFKLCVENNECEEGSNTEAIFAFSLLDIRGSPNNGNGVEGKTWLSGGFRGTPISRTSDWLTAAGLVVYRMPGEKSCLTSANGGLSSVNVSGKIGATVTEDTRDCIPVTLTEVSCDVQNQDNSGFQRQGSR